MPPSLATSIRGVAQNLALPHGFTLIVGATAWILVGERGYPGFLGVWLFVIAANAALIASQALLQAHRHPVTPAASGYGIYNLAPTATVPLVFVCTTAIGPDNLAFAAAGAISAGCYLLLSGGLIAALAGRSPRGGRHPRPPGEHMSRLRSG